MVRGLRRLDLRGSRAGVCVGLERRIVRRIVVDRRHLTVDAAFGLVPTAPAARARVFARLDLRRARRAAERGVTFGLPRVARQRTDARRAGKGCFSKCRSRCWQNHKKTNTKRESTIDQYKEYD